ncbi:MAG: hypothetical protein QOF51_1035, partial [Chloroflexota bacterium]|nr:hypothetical protein [Chloroflexota bacterium]
MNDASASELQRLLAVEFDQRGWQYDLDTAHSMVDEAVRCGAVDVQALAAQAPAAFLRRNHTDRDALARAIERAIGGRVPVPEQGSKVTLVAQDNRQYHLSMGPGAQITDSNVNVGATQINIQPGAHRDELLAGVRALVRAGLTGDWDADAARALSRTLEGRDDIEYTDVEEVTAEVVKEEAATQGRVRDFMSKVAAGGLGGALSHGIIAGAAQ